MAEKYGVTGEYSSALSIGTSNSNLTTYFATINAAALPYIRTLCDQWLPGGSIVGHEYVARNPRRADRSPGSFKINLRSGKWSDFAIHVGGHDLISLAAYLFDMTQGEAARHLAALLGLAR